MAELLRLEGVTLRNQEDRVVFEGLDWSLAVGDRVRVDGVAGAGTTTLLRLCAGLAHPQAGRVILGGQPLGPYTFDHPFLKRGGIGWVPTEGGLLVNLTLRANVALPLRFLRGQPQSRAEEIAQEQLERLGLGLQAERRPHALEPRDRWLGALARAAVMAPELWMLDHPPGGLEGEGQRRAVALLQEAAGNMTTTILTAGSQAWPGIVNEEIHLEQGRLVPGGL